MGKEQRLSMWLWGRDLRALGQMYEMEWCGRQVGEQGEWWWCSGIGLIPSGRSEVPLGLC